MAAGRGRQPGRVPRPPAGRAPAPLRSPRTHIVRAAAARSAPAPGANAGRARHAGGASATAVETSPRRRSDARLSAAGSPGRWRTGGDRSIRWSSLFVSFFPPERRGKNKTKQNNKPEPKPNAKQRYSTANFRRPPQDAHPARVSDRGRDGAGGTRGLQPHAHLFAGYRAAPPARPSAPPRCGWARPRAAPCGERGHLRGAAAASLRPALPPPPAGPSPPSRRAAGGARAGGGPQVAERGACGCGAAGASLRFPSSEGRCGAAAPVRGGARGRPGGKEAPRDGRETRPARIRTGWASVGRRQKSRGGIGEGCELRGARRRADGGRSVGKSCDVPYLKLSPSLRAVTPGSPIGTSSHWLRSSAEPDTSTACLGHPELCRRAGRDALTMTARANAGPG